MVRAPCCEKMGLKKGPWTADEDQILVAYISRYGHGNWRALPKHAGLLRCGKSCRLRWTNYLRPDIKRGNFSKEEEDTVISLHEKLGNRWSAIAASLPGRTDNEIKNVWHTHIKKRLKQNHEVEESKRNAPCKGKKINVSLQTYPENLVCRPVAFQPNPVSPEWSCSDISSSGTDLSAMTRENNCASIRDDCITSSQEFYDINESFWSEALTMENSNAPMDIPTDAPLNAPVNETLHTTDSSNDDDDGMINFWLRIFMEAGDL